MSANRYDVRATTRTMSCGEGRPRCRAVFERDGLEAADLKTAVVDTLDFETADFETADFKPAVFETAGFETTCAEAAVCGMFTYPFTKEGLLDRVRSLRARRPSYWIAVN